MDLLRQRLRERLAEVRARGLYRALRPLQPLDATRARLEGRTVEVFCSNDYLGLAHHPEVRAAWRGGGSGSSRLVSGSRPAHAALEAALEERFGQPALVFSSGYQANLAVATTLFSRGDRVASDAANHASLIDGLRLSRAERTVLPHGQPPRDPSRLAGVVVEGLYSMDGDRLDLRRWQGSPCLVVDEAHAVGCLGPGGQGVAADQGILPEVRVGTLGKAYGAAGAFVLGPPELKELLVSTGRSFLFTTALAEPAAHAGLAGLQRADDARREALAANVRRLRAGLAREGLAALGADHVVPLVLGPTTLAVAEELLARGFLAVGIRPPTVPAGSERIRITVSAAHPQRSLDLLVEALAEAVDAVARRTPAPAGRDQPSPRAR